MNQLDIALAYAKNGIKVFPCSETKAPIIKGAGGFKSATKSIKKIQEWWSKYPNALIGSPNDQFTVIDVDNYGLCETGKLLTDMALSKLESTGVLSRKSMRVTTMSGGTHIYFKKCEFVSRSINCLPNIDLLGDGGYVILPDQENYVADIQRPWEAITSLPPFDHGTFSYVQDEFESHTKAARLLKPAKEKARSKRHKKITEFNGVMKTDIDGFVQLQQDVEKFGGNLGGIDYELRMSMNPITFVETPQMYRKCKEGTLVPVDYTTKIMVNGSYLEASEGFLNSEMITKLFYNQEIQKKLLKLCGLTAPAVGRRNLQHSVLPGHRDVNKSMGCRWSHDGSHIIVRDFTNFFSSKYQQCDYNVVRLYAAKKYNANVQRLNPPEFVIWFTRMLVEAGIIKIDGLIQPLAQEGVKLGRAEQQVLQSFLELDAMKRLYDGYDGTTTFADKFSAAWTGVSTSSVGRVKHKLVEKGLLEYAGVYDCSGGKRTDGFYETPLYRVVVKSNKIKVSGVFNRDVLEMKKRRKEYMATQFDSVKKYEVKNTVPASIGTIYSIGVTDVSYGKLLNFLDDMGVPNPVMQQNMVAPIMTSDSIVDDVISEPTKGFPVGKLRLVEDDGFNDKRILMLTFESPDFNDLWEDINKKHWDKKDDHTDIPAGYLILSHDLEDDEIDVDQLNVRISEYTGGEIGLQGVTTKYLLHDQIDALMDGEDYHDID